MKTIRTAARQPLKTSIGILVVTLSVSILCVCLGQSMVAAQTEATLESNFTTVALPTAKYQYEQAYGGHVITFSRQMPEEILSLLTKTAEDHPDIVKSVSSPGLASAYIPDLVPDNYTNHPLNELTSTNINYFLCPLPDGMPYSCALLEIELTEIGEPVQQFETKQQADGILVKAEKSIKVSLEGIITSVIGLQEGFSDPTGFTARIDLILPDSSALDALGLITGEEYIVFGMDYYDTDWHLREQLNKYDIVVDQFDPNAISYLSDEQIEQNKTSGGTAYTVAYYNHNGTNIALSQYDIEKFRAITLTVEDKSILPKYTWNEQEDGTLTPQLLNTRSFLDENGETVTCTLEEYRQRYSVPTISRIVDSVDTLLSSEEGAIWSMALQQIQINSHAFPVIGVEQLGYIADFARETANIVAGRDFTQDELDSGESVCIISESLAASNNLSVGDTITLHYYLYDWSSPYQKYISNGHGVVNPSAYFYTSTTDLTEEKTYTIVGFYRQDNAWANVEEDIYSFTPNTVFVPQSSVTGSMDYGDQAFFRTYVLANGSVEQFQKMIADAGYDGLFVYYDQGYSVIADSLYDYKEVANQTFVIGISVFAVLMALYFLLFPMQNKKDIAIMEALGASRKSCVCHIISGSLCIMVPASVLGFALSICCWQQVMDGLYSSDAIILPSEIDIAQFLLIVCLQLAAATLLTGILALWMTREQKLLKRK